MLQEDEGYINRELLDRVDHVMEDELLHDDDWKTWERTFSDEEKQAQEDRHLSKLGRLIKNFTKTDFAVAVIIAMENYPFMVLQIVAEYLVNKERKKKK